MNFKNWLTINDITENTHFMEWLSFLEATTAARYSVEVNFRTKKNECILSFAKIVLGYVSAALKQSGYHVKQVFEQSPLRIIVSSRNWDDGEWNLIVSFNPDQDFIISRGFYNKESQSISIMRSEKAAGDSAAEIVNQVRNELHTLKNMPDKHLEKLRPVPLKRGPK